MNDFKPSNPFEGYMKGCLEGFNREMGQMRKDFTQSLEGVKTMFTDRNKAELKVWLTLLVIFAGSLGQLIWFVKQITDIDRRVKTTEERRVEDSTRVDNLYEVFYRTKRHSEEGNYHIIDVPN